MFKTSLLENELTSAPLHTNIHTRQEQFLRKRKLHQIKRLEAARTFFETFLNDHTGVPLDYLYFNICSFTFRPPLNVSQLNDCKNNIYKSLCHEWSLENNLDVDRVGERMASRAAKSRSINRFRNVLQDTFSNKCSEALDIKMATVSKKRKINRVGRLGPPYETPTCVNNVQEYGLDDFQNGQSSHRTLSIPTLSEFVLEGSQLFSQRSKSKPTTSVQTVSDSLEYEANPDIPPYQTGQFMSSTMLKKIPITKRHLDTFGAGTDFSLLSRRGVMLHTDRYQLDFMKSMDSTCQRERLQAGMDYMESMRGTRRKREMLPHRAEFDLIMGGKQIEFEERFDIAREIQKLKAVAMPTHAKDLFHGRGIKLPSNHMSIHPRHQLPNDIEEEMSLSAPNPLQHLQQRTPEPRMFRNLTSLDRNMSFGNNSSFKKHPRLPSIPARTESTGTTLYNPSTPWSTVTWTDDNQQDPRISMFQERRTVSNLSARLGFPGRLHRDVTPLSRAQSQVASPPLDQSTNRPKNRFITKGIAEQMNQKKPLRAVYIHHAKDSKLQENSSFQDSSSPIQESRKAEDELNKSGRSKSNALLESGDGETLGRDNLQLHPLQGTDLMTSLPLEEQEELRQTFNRLDTDLDGHLKYNQLKSQLPKIFSEKQEKYMEEVYNLIDSVAFFGIDEFMIMNHLSKTVESLNGRASEAFETLDFAALPQDLKRYLGQFQDNDVSNTGKISVEHLRKILANTIAASFLEDQVLWDKILESIALDYSGQISKIAYIAHVPLFLMLENECKES